MPNQNNFRSDVTTKTEPRFTASRIVKFPTEGTLLEEIPASIGYDEQDNIEIHFYTIPSNTLLLSLVTTPNEEYIKSHIVSYNDGTYKNYIQIDFTKLFLGKEQLLVPGDYRMVLNFFSDEIGSYFDRVLSFNEISSTGTEVELVFNNVVDDVQAEINNRLLREFILRSFAKPDAIGIVEKIFKSGLELNDATEGVIAQNVIDNIQISSIGQTYSNTIARMEKLNLLPEFIKQLNDFLSTLFEKIKEEIVINGDERIQEDEFVIVFRKVIAKQLPSLQARVDSRIIIS